MSSTSALPLNQVLVQLLVQLMVQLLALVLGLGLSILVAHVFDSFELSLTYFSCLSLLIGLYVCPTLIGLSLPITIYYQSRRNVSIQMKALIRNPLKY